MSRTALITGASAGLGKEFAKQYAEQGHNLVLVARREDRLTDFAEQLQSEYPISVTVIAMDLAEANAAQLIFDKTEALGIDIDILINNAGYGLTGKFTSHSLGTFQHFLQVMVTSVVALSRLYVEGMLSRGYGRIINVSSVAAFLPGSAGNNLYTGAKSLLNSFSETLHKEVSRKGVNVTAICPGFTRTEFHDQEGFEDAKNNIPNFLWSKAEDVVGTALAASENGSKTIVIHGLTYKLLAFLLWLLPKPALDKLLG